LAGAGYGAMHYSLSVLRPKVLPFWPQKDRIYLSSALISGALTHCAMFSTYEFTKDSTVRLTGIRSALFFVVVVVAKLLFIIRFYFIGLD
jgi:hypothetical protein